LRDIWRDVLSTGGTRAESAVVFAAEVGSEPKALVALVVFTIASLGLGVAANRFVGREAGFLKKYFLGNRSLGAFAVALTAAVMSGGTFLGFPAFVYAYGWITALWIGSYMVAPLTVLGVMGKRIGRMARRTGAITLPDLFRERFGSPTLGLITSVLVMLFLTCNLIPQFKAGGVIMKKVLPAAATDWATSPPSDDLDIKVDLDTGYMIGLTIFTATVTAYTAYGGFLAAVWTDVFQSVVMAIGVLILLPLSLWSAGGLAAATARGVHDAGIGYAFGPGAGRSFHPITLAVSFFFMWAITSMGQPSTLVRLMAFRDTRTLRYSMIYLTIYNFIIYVPLILIFIAARSVVPGLSKPDEAMPSLVIKLANPYVAGLIMAAPYGAVMSTVSGFLLIIASGLTRDVYQRFLRPRASEKEIALMGHVATVGVGLVVALVALRPPEFLQLIIIFSSAGMAAAFLVPALMGVYWRRATAAGAIAASLAGSGVVIALYALGMLPIQGTIAARLLPANPDIGPDSSFRPYYLLGFDPCVWGLASSLVAGIAVSLFTKPPDEARLSLVFDDGPAVESKFDPPRPDAGSRGSVEPEAPAEPSAIERRNE
jgi:sodium/pantothenate symporter